LGADYRIFQNIDLQGHEVININWVEPEKEDTLATFAHKLIDKFNILPDSILIGNSLGGMFSIEIAKKIKTDKVILISSIKTIKEAPLSFQLYKYIPLYHIVLTKLMGAVRLIIRLVFGNMPKAEEDLFVSMLQNTSPVFIQWAKTAILNWDNQTIPPNVFHIHGDHDNVLPHKRIKDVTIIKGGTHIMIFDRANEINAWLKPILST
jgi:pimeloyl-ACP methyl ester carboxylesterase